MKKTVIKKDLMKPTPPIPEEIKDSRLHAGLSQTAAAKVVFATLSSWQQWEYDGDDQTRRRRMHPAFYELFMMKTGQSQLKVIDVKETENVKPRLVKGASQASMVRMMKKVESLPKETSHELQSYARTRWLLVLLSYTGLSLAKIAKLKMSDFIEDAFAHDLRDELNLYRRHMNLPEAIATNDNCPAIIKFGNESEFMSRAGLHLIIKPILEVQ